MILRAARGWTVDLPALSQQRVRRPRPTGSKVRLVPSGLNPVWLKVEVPRYRCEGCGKTWESGPLVSGRMRISPDSSSDT